MTYKSPQNTLRLVLVMIILIMICFLLPMFWGLFSDASICNIVSSSSYGLLPAWCRSILFSILSCVLSTYGGLQLAICFRNITIDSPIGKALSFLMLPFMLGDVTVSYVFKLSLYDTQFFHWMTEGHIAQSICIILIQSWEYCFLFAYLFWLVFQNLPKSVKSYAKTISLTDHEMVKDIYLPAAKNLFILLFLLCFVFSFYEYVKCEYVFQFSQGTNTEFLSQAFYRIYKIKAPSDPQTALFQMDKVGFLVMLSACLLMLVIGLILILGVNYLIGKKTSIVPFLTNTPSSLPYICIGAILLPVIVALKEAQYGFSMSDMLILVLPLSLTLISAIVAATYAIAFGISSKIIFPRRLSGFNKFSMAYLLLIFLLQMIPSACLMICGHKLLSIIGYKSIAVYLAWILGHAILTFPVLSSFVIANHFVVSYREIDWQFCHRISLKDIINYSFLKRFRFEYLMTCLFAFVLIWNDSVWNKVLSDFIPSFSDMLQRSIKGRASDVSHATLFALIAVLISSACFYFWLRIINKNTKEL